MALLVPLPDGSNVTWKVVEPDADTGLDGLDVTLKSAAFVPLSVGLANVKLDVPVFCIVKVRTTVPEHID